MNRVLHTTVLALAALLAGGCQSQWYLERTNSEIVRTELVVRTEPTGALVHLNGKRMDAAPVRIPIEYEHRTEQWVRQSNQGARIRDESEGIGTVLLAPVWIGASVMHGREEMKRHVYEDNRHVVDARLAGYADASAEVVLDGQAEVEVVIKLTPTGR